MRSSPLLVLVVDDDAKTLKLVRAYLEREGFRVVTAGDGRTALGLIEDEMPDLIVLDLMLPELDGMTVARRVRESSDVPILMFSARGTVADRIQGLTEGADDYLPKPFSPAELIVRVKAILRRSRGTRVAEVLRIGDVEIDRGRHEVRHNGQALPMTTAEFRLLLALAEADGRVLSRDALLDTLYGSGASETLDRTIDVYVGRLRERLGDDPEQSDGTNAVRWLVLERVKLRRPTRAYGQRRGRAEGLERR